MTAAGKLSIENVDADSSDVLHYFLPIVGWKVLYETSQRIESDLGGMRPSGGGSSPLPGTRPRFTADGGVATCLDRAYANDAPRPAAGHRPAVRMRQPNRRKASSARRPTN